VFVVLKCSIYLLFHLLALGAVFFFCHLLFLACSISSSLSPSSYVIPFVIFHLPIYFISFVTYSLFLTAFHYTSQYPSVFHLLMYFVYPSLNTHFCIPLQSPPDTAPNCQFKYLLFFTINVSAITTGLG
jgi:hypothetical protein